uniref:rab9 effector protein with kelch motifs-like isoform X2 n=1 Tax=Myxine glutinosa TaxID=7769 RepID=UPI00358F8451
MRKLEVFALWNVTRAPRQFICKPNRLSFSLPLLLPLPPLVVVFTRGSWAAYSPGATASVSLSGPDGADPQVLGSLSVNNPFVWEGTWRDDLQKAIESMADQGQQPRLQIFICGQVSDTESMPRAVSAVFLRSRTVGCNDASSQEAEVATRVSVPHVTRRSGSAVSLRTVSTAEGDETVKNARGATSIEQVKPDVPNSPVAASLLSKQSLLGDVDSKENGEVEKKEKMNGKRNWQKLSLVADEVVACKKPSQTVPSADHPSPRWGHSLCLTDDSTALIVGGHGKNLQFCIDSLWKYHTESHSWFPADAVSTGTTPEVRVGHSATFDPEANRVYVFGGSKNKKWFGDLYFLDLNGWRWSCVEAKGKVPSLAYHSATLFRQELFVFGGVFPRPHPEPDGCGNSLYIFNPQHSIWYQPIVVGQKPCPRSGHSTTLLQKKLVIFGGWDAPVCFKDLHILDLGFMEYTPVKVKGCAPSARCWHASAPVSDNRLIIHGGYDGRKVLSDTYIFNLDGFEWTRIKKDLGLSARAGHTLLALPAEESEKKGESAPSPCTLLAFGGGDNIGGFFNDSVTISLETLYGL